MTQLRTPAVFMCATVVFLIAANSLPLCGQQPSAANNIVPTLVQFSGVLSESGGKPLTGITGIRFSLYAEQEGGAPLWMETQNVEPDASGHYSVMLGCSGETRYCSVFLEFAKLDLERANL